MRAWLVAVGFSALLAIVAQADPSQAQQTQGAAVVLQPLIPVAEAHARASAGEIVLVDIRTPEEWRETGLPASAHAITMHQDPRVFTQQLLAAMGGDRTRPVALICRTGNRSSTLVGQLRKAGITNVADVGEGMAGSRYGKGWLKTGLPTRPGSQAGMPPQTTVQKAVPK